MMMMRMIRIFNSLFFFFFFFISFNRAHRCHSLLIKDMESEHSLMRENQYSLFLSFFFIFLYARSNFRFLEKTANATRKQQQKQENENYNNKQAEHKLKSERAALHRLDSTQLASQSLATKFIKITPIKQIERKKTKTKQNKKRTKQIEPPAERLQTTNRYTNDSCACLCICCCC